VLRRAFADPARAPDALRRVLAHPPAAQLDALVALVARGARPSSRPRAPLHLVWGTDDRLPTARADDARKLARALDAPLVLIPSAGHCRDIVKRCGSGAHDQAAIFPG
jgi:2-hydroxy-6-oxonona-2,4-dienedioate hydrolase